MRFSKKLVFLQYWFAKIEKFSITPNISIGPSWVLPEVEPILTGASRQLRSLQNHERAHCVRLGSEAAVPSQSSARSTRSGRAKRTLHCVTTDGSYAAVTTEGSASLRKYASGSFTPLARRFSALQLDTSYNVKSGTRTLLLDAFGAPKPWYSYWLLPFMGFVVVLDASTSKQSLVSSTRRLYTNSAGNLLTDMGFPQALQGSYAMSSSEMSLRYKPSEESSITTFRSYGFKSLDLNPCDVLTVTQQKIPTFSSSHFSSPTFSGFVPKSRATNNVLLAEGANEVQQANQHQPGTKYQKVASLLATSFQYRKLNSFMIRQDDTSIKMSLLTKQMNEANVSKFKSRRAHEVSLGSEAAVLSVEPRHQLKKYSSICDFIVTQLVFTNDNNYTNALLDHLNQSPTLVNGKGSEYFAAQSSKLDHKNICAFFSLSLQKAANSHGSENSQNYFTWWDNHLSKRKLRFSQHYNDLVYLYNVLLEKNPQILTSNFAFQSNADFPLIVLKNDFLAPTHKTKLLLENSGEPKLSSGNSRAFSSEVLKEGKTETNHPFLQLSTRDLVPVWVSNSLTFDKRASEVTASLGEHRRLDGFSRGSKPTNLIEEQQVRKDVRSHNVGGQTVMRQEISPIHSTFSFGFHSKGSKSCMYSSVFLFAE